MRNKIISTILGIVLPYYLLLMPTILAFEAQSAPNYPGIDVSGWQGRINYAQVKQAGIEIVYMKASEGTNFVDPYFNENYEQAKANNLKVGFYHYVTARTTEEARNEAQFFISVIAGKNPDCLLAMDFESFGNLNSEQKIGRAHV